MKEFVLKSPADTEELAQKIAATLKDGEILGLIGELGAGKTCFVKGLSKGLNVPKDCYVSSPTFTILKIYNGDKDIYHFDFYRLYEADEFEELGFDDYLKESGIVVIEWADKFLDLLPSNVLMISFAVIGPQERKLTLPEELVKRLGG